jgi:hypothetical protein
MNIEQKNNMMELARQIAEELVRNQGMQMLPTTTPALQACGTSMPSNGCEGLLYAPITALRFYRSGRTELPVILDGLIPVVPGSSVTLAQEVRPPWPTGCYSLRYRLANNANNHDEVMIEWYLDDEQLDTKHYGSEIYNSDGTVIGDGLLPVPMAMGQHCCVGGNNRLRARISHLGNNNQIENIRLFVHHGKGVKCCSSCSMGRACDCGGGHS